MRGTILDPISGKPIDHRGWGDDDLARKVHEGFELAREHRRLERAAFPHPIGTNVPPHVLANLDKAAQEGGRFNSIRNSRNDWQETLFQSTQTETALTAAAEAVIFPASTVPEVYGAIPGGYMEQGRCLHLRVFGQCSTAATPGTFTFRIRWGGVAGTLLAASAATTMSASQTNVSWRGEFYIVCRSSGSSGSLLATGIIESAAIPTTGQFLIPATAPAPVTATTLATTDLALTHNPSLATASLAGVSYTLESLN